MQKPVCMTPLENIICLSLDLIIKAPLKTQSVIFIFSLFLPNLLIMRLSHTVSTEVAVSAIGHLIFVVSTG